MLTDFFWYFILYSFFGFLLEVGFARANRNPKKDRKCLYLLPLCPVYGLGALFILLIPSSVAAHPLLLVLLGGVFATLAEYLMGCFYERVLRVSFWDYSALPFNVNGRVCLPFSLIWGALAAGLIYGIHPHMKELVSNIPPFWTVLTVSVALGDAGVSCYLLRHFQSTQALRWYQAFAPNPERGQ